MHPEASSSSDVRRYATSRHSTAPNRGLQGGEARLGAQTQARQQPACMPGQDHQVRARDGSPRERAQDQALEARAAEVRLPHVRGARTATRGGERRPRTPGALSRRGRSGTASGRDDRAHMERSRSRRGNLDRSQVVVAGHRGNTQERARPQDPSHETPCIGSQGPSAPEGRARVLSSGREPVHTVGDRSGAPVRVQACWASPDRIAHPSSHLLLAPRNAWSGAEGDSGTRGALDPRDDDAVHAPRPDRASSGSSRLVVGR